jgi:hypothetical protein
LSGVAAGLLLPASVDDAAVVLVIVASVDPVGSLVDADAVLLVAASSLAGDFLSVFAGDCSALSDSFLAMFVSAVAVLCVGVCAVVNVVSVVCTVLGAAFGLDLGCGQASAPPSAAGFIGQAAALPVAAALGLGFGCASFFGAMRLDGFSYWILTSVIIMKCSKPALYLQIGPTESRRSMPSECNENRKQ